MHLTGPQPRTCKLSICITTFNRGAFIGATIASIATQVTTDCEIVVLDGGSTDDTESVVLDYARRYECVRYVNQERNNGFDRDCHRAVELAFGEYCWLMSDDDLLRPGAIATVLLALEQDLSLVVVNWEVRDPTMSTVLQSRGLGLTSERLYGPSEIDELFIDVGGLSYVAAVIIKRSIWLSRDKERYFGSRFIHVGVIFQARLPGPALAIAEPLISYRMGNAHTWSPSEIFLSTWPSLLTSLAISDRARKGVYTAEPWAKPQWLLFLRGMGFYSISDYNRWLRPRLHSASDAWAPKLVALIPGAIINMMFLLYCLVIRRSYLGTQPELVLQTIRESRFYFRNWYIIKAVVRS